MPITTILVIVLAILALIVIVLFIIISQYVNLYIQAMLSSAPVSMFDMIGMRFRRVDIKTIVYNHIRGVRAGLPIPIRTLETHALAGGNVPNVVSALILARKHNLELDWNRAAAIDLAGRDILSEVQSAANPWEVEHPAPGEPPLRAAPRDGRPLHIRARIALATNLSKLVGGATQDILLARIEEAIIGTIALRQSEADADPATIAAALMEQNLDRGTAFDILEINLTITPDNLAPTTESNRAVPS